jgi:hypothetical protein
MVKSDLTSVPEILFPGVVGRAEHHHLSWCFKSVWLYLFLSLWLKSRPPDHVDWHQKFFFHKMMLIHCTKAHLPSPSVATHLLCRLHPSTLGHHYMDEIAIPWLDKFPLCRISPFLRFFIRNHQPYLADLHPYTTVGSLSLNPTELSLI